MKIGSNKRRALVCLVGLGLVVAASAAWAGVSAPPKGAVRGYFSTGFLASSDQLAQYQRGSNVWCAWRGDHVIVHVSLRNTSAEHVTNTIKPRYYIARGGEHGSSFMGAQDFDFNSGELRSLFIDAGHAKGISWGPRLTGVPHTYS